LGIRKKSVSIDEEKGILFFFRYRENEILSSPNLNLPLDLTLKKHEASSAGNSSFQPSPVEFKKKDRGPFPYFKSGSFLLKISAIGSIKAILNLPIPAHVFFRR